MIISTENIIERFVKNHGDRYDYSLVEYKNARTTVIIKCKIHGKFSQLPSNHLKGKGCYQCSLKSLSLKFRLPTNEFINRSNKIHGNFYDYSKFNYVNAHVKGIITCPKHNEFLQDSAHHLRGHGCPKCVGRNKSTGEFIEQCRLLYGNKYDYSKVNYVGCEDNVIIICRKHGEFLQDPDNHLHGRECPNCNTSKAEDRIRHWLQKNNIDYISQKTFDDCKNPKTDCKLRFDFYIPLKNLLIEYDGEQHSNVIISRRYQMTQKDLDYNKFRDKVKTDYAARTNMPLLRISYKEKTNIENILQNELLNKGNI